MSTNNTPESWGGRKSPSYWGPCPGLPRQSHLPGCPASSSSTLGLPSLCALVHDANPFYHQGIIRKAFLALEQPFALCVLRLMKLEPSVLGAESLSRETQGQAPARHTETTVRAMAFLAFCPLPAGQRGGDSGKTLIIVTAQIMPFLQFKYSYRCILYQLYIYILQNIFISVSYAHTHTHCFQQRGKAESHQSECDYPTFTEKGDGLPRSGS